MTPLLSTETSVYRGMDSKDFGFWTFRASGCLQESGRTKVLVGRIKKTGEIVSRPAVLKVSQVVTVLPKEEQFSEVEREVIKKSEAAGFKGVAEALASVPNKNPEKREFITQTEAAKLERVHRAGVKNIVEPIATFSCGPMGCLAVELVNGEELFHLINRKGGLSFDEIRRIAIPLLKTLSSLKKLDIAVLDLKPENILVNAQTWKVKLIDFEGAKHFKDKEKHDYRWTCATAAPEHFLELPYDCSFDMWSFAVVLFAAYTGENMIQYTGEEPPEEQCFNDAIYTMASVVGMPPAFLLRQAPNTNRYFIWNRGKWWIRNPPSPTLVLRNWKLINKLIYNIADRKGYPEKDAGLFLSFLRGMVRYVGRMTPDSALKHGFITRKIRIE